MSLLSIQLSQYELEDIFEDGSNCAQTCSHILNSYHDGDDQEEISGITLTALLAGSKKLRSYLSNLKTDPIFCSLMNSDITLFVSMAQIRRFAEVGKLIEVERIGSMIYDSKTCKKGVWYVLVSGKLKVSRYEEDETDEECIPQHELSSGEFFGGFGRNTDMNDVVHIKIEILQPSKFLEMSETVLTDLANEHPEIYGKFMSRMAGKFLGRFIRSPRIHDLTFDFFWSINSDLDPDLDSESSWHYLSSRKSHEMSEYVLNVKGPRPSTKDRRPSMTSEKLLRNSLERKLSGPSQRSFHLMRRTSRAVVENEFDDRMLRSEMELNSIKTTVIALENLWRDISMGTDHISVSTLSSIHKELGEIGSELFGRIFMNKSNSAQV